MNLKTVFFYVLQNCLSSCQILLLLVCTVILSTYLVQKDHHRTFAEINQIRQNLFYNNGCGFGYLTHPLQIYHNSFFSLDQ